MRIQKIRFANIIFAAVMLINGYGDFCWYIAAMQLSLEILNSQPLYIQQGYKMYNTMFWLYSLVLLERLRTTHFSEITEWLLNCAEHLFFGIVICTKVYVYTAVFTNVNAQTRFKRALFAFALFNVIGVVNEVFQNLLGHRSILQFIPDSLKDIRMNLLGAAVFMAAVMVRMLQVNKLSFKKVKS